MVFRSRSARSVASVLVCVAVAAGFLATAGEAKSNPKHKPDPGPPPAFRIEVAPLGYVAPSRFYLIGRLASATLDFIDNSHLLFTFRASGLLPRIPNDPKDDTDQIIHAVVLDISSGKVQQETDWRMHDRRPYLWAIGHGQFLLRQRQLLYLTDRNLELRPYLRFDSALQAVSVSPDHKLLMVELEKYDLPDPNQSGPPAAMNISGPSTQIVMVRISDDRVVAESSTRHPVELPLLDNSFLEVLEGDHPDKWIIRNKPFTGEPAVVTQLKSACDPSVITLSENVAIASLCPAGSGDHLVTAFSLQGTPLWQDRWEPRYIWPTFEFAENGSRFAYGSLQLNHAIGTMDPFGEDDVVAQMVGVFDTDTGKLALVKNATPLLSSGHNYALSADGSRFAILREGAIEVYDLPPVSPPPAIAKASAK